MVDAALVSEAVVEDIGIKRLVIAEVEAHCPRNCLITTNSLTISMIGFISLRCSRKLSRCACGRRRAQSGGEGGGQAARVQEEERLAPDHGAAAYRTTTLDEGRGAHEYVDAW